MKALHLIQNTIFRAVCCISVLLCLPAKAAEVAQTTDKIPYFAEKYDYYIKNYDVFLSVDVNRNVNVQEIITLNFKNPQKSVIKHRIPKMHGRISDIKVSEPYKETDKLGEVILKISAGDAQKQSTIKQYKVSYNHQLFDNDDTFDFQIIKPEWKVPLQRVRFKLQLPENVKQQDIHLFIDKKEVKSSADGAEYIMKEDRVIGQTTLHGLKPKQRLRIKIDVPAGFFVNNGKNYASFVWAGLLFMTLLSILFWYLYGQDDRVPAIISSNPPRGINAAEAELIHDGVVTEKSLTALIVSLANRGYLTINTVGKNFTLAKIKNYTGRNSFIKQVLQVIFGSREVAESSELKSSGRFYRKWKEMQELADKPSTLRHFRKRSPLQYLRRVIMAGCAAGNILLTLFVLQNYMFSEEYLIISGLVLIIGFIGIKMYSEKVGPISRIIGIIFLLYGLWLMWFGQSYDIQKEDVLLVLIGVVCSMISLFCLSQMPKPNAVGRMHKGQLFGLKNFIKFADKERVEKLFRNNPSYFYKILPYAYILGLHNEWLKLFDNLEIPIPSWSENDNFKIRNFLRNFPAGISAALASSSLCDDDEED